MEYGDRLNALVSKAILFVRIALLVTIQKMSYDETSENRALDHCQPRE